jgi:hypothetical protein
VPLDITPGRPTLVIRRASYERVGLVRSALDERLGLTPDEFRVEGGAEHGFVALGPVHDEDALGALVADLEALGLAYFDDYFEVPASWPAWLRVYLGEPAPGGTGAGTSSGVQGA